MRLEGLEKRHLLAALGLSSALVKADGRIMQLEFSGPVGDGPGQPDWMEGNAEGLRLTTSTGTELEPLGTVATVEGSDLIWTVTCLVPEGSEVIQFDTTGLTVSAPEGLIRDNAGFWTEGFEGAAVENRSLVDADGFTTDEFTRGAGGVTLYVSTTKGNDSRSLSQAQDPATPVKTLSRALALISANGKAQTGSAVRLLRGDIFAGDVNLKVGGPDRQHPFVLEDYWYDYRDGRRDPRTRPVIRADWSKGQYTGLRSTVDASPGSLDNVVIRRLKIEAVNRSGANKMSYGLQLMAGGQNWTIDDCVVHNFVTNIAIHGFFARYDELTVLRTTVTDAHLENSTTPNNHTQGMYSNKADDLLISQSFFDRNGWTNRAFTGRDQYSHNIYLQMGNAPSVVWGNVIHAGGSYGIQMRSGGILAYNHMGRNGLAAYIGTPGGAQIRNVVELGQNVGSLSTGDGLAINATAGDVLAMAVEFNIIVNSQGSKQAAIATQFKPYTIVNAAIQHNTIVDGGSLYHGMPTAGIVPDADSVRVENNLFDTGPKSVVKGFQAPGAVEDWSWLTSDENLIYNDGVQPQFQHLTQTRHYDMNLEGWQDRTGTEENSTWLALQYVNPLGNLGLYSESMGGPNTESAYITALRGRGAGEWLARYDMANVYDYYAEQYRVTNAPAADEGAFGFYGATDYRESEADLLPAPDLVADRDSGVSQEDNVTFYRSFLRFIARGTAERSTLELLRDGVVVGRAAGGLAEVTLLDRSALPDGVYEYSVRQTGRGGETVMSAVTRVTVDTSIPSAPPTPDLDSPDDGSDGPDRKTADGRLSFQVTASDPTMTVELWRRSATDSRSVYERVGSRVGSGMVEDVVPIAPGTYRYVVCQVTVAGRKSRYSPYFLVTVTDGAV